MSFEKGRGHEIQIRTLSIALEKALGPLGLLRYGYYAVGINKKSEMFTGAPSISIVQHRLLLRIVRRAEIGIHQAESACAYPRARRGRAG